MAKRHLVSGILVVLSLLAHTSQFAWEPRPVAGCYVDGVQVTAIGVWRAENASLTAALLLGVVVPTVLLGVAVVVSREWLVVALHHLSTLIKPVGRII